VCSSVCGMGTGAATYVGGRAVSFKKVSRNISSEGVETRLVVRIVSGNPRTPCSNGGFWGALRPLLSRGRKQKRAYTPLKPKSTKANSRMTKREVRRID